MRLVRGNDGEGGRREEGAVHWQAMPSARCKAGTLPKLPDREREALELRTLARPSLSPEGSSWRERLDADCTHSACRWTTFVTFPALITLPY